MRSPFQTKLYTSFFANRNISNADVCPIRISIGSPRFAKEYGVEKAIPELMPKPGMLRLRGTKFFDAYLSLLDKLGKDKAIELINKLPAKDRPIVLLCFEDIRKPGMFCHRRIVAEWITEVTGVTVPEYPVK